MKQQFADEQSISLAAAGLGVAGLCFLDVLGLLASPRHAVVFHRVGSPEALFLPALLDLLVVGAAAFALFYGVRGRGLVRRWVWSAMLGVLPWIVLKDVAALLEKSVPHAASLGCFSFCLVLIVVGAFWLKAPGFEAVRRCGQAVLLAAALPTAMLTLQTVWFGYQARHLNDAAATPSPVAPASTVPSRRVGRGRVIWLVLDELAFRQVFEAQPAGVELPEFDRLKAEATLFTQVTQPAHYTEVALPSLIAGQPADEVSFSADGVQATLRLGKGRPWALHERDTVFADAHELGYRTALVGWYVPYCRILPTVLASCYWTGQNSLSNLYPGQSVVANAIYPAVRLANRAPNFLLRREAASADESAEGTRHLRDFLDLKQHSDAALGSDAYDFVFLHIPVPHPMGIYDRRTRKFAINHSNYVDNLALADLYLGELRRTLEAKGEWEDATVVVMGDHSWRTDLLWKDNRPWTAEDQKASEGGDDRPAYAVKLPHQTHGTQIATRFEAVRTRALLDVLLRGEIADPDELQAWVEGRRTRYDVASDSGHAIPR